MVRRETQTSVRPGWMTFAMMATLAGGCGSDGEGDPAFDGTIGIEDGDGQAAPPGTALANPVRVVVLDGAGNPIVATVDWTVVTGGGSMAPVSTATNAADGIASSTWTLGPTAGGQTVRATVNGSSPAVQVVFSATATSGGGAVNGRILFWRPTATAPFATLHTINPDGTGGALVGNGSNGYYSPDAQSIVYACDASGASDLCIMNADGTGIQNFTQSPAPADADLEPSWSSTGRIVWSRGGDLWSRLADGTGTETQLTSPATNDDDFDSYPEWSADGTRIVFSSNRNGPGPSTGFYEIWVMNANGSGQTQLTTSPGAVRDNREPSWSPDGTRIAYYRTSLEATSGDITSNVFVKNAADTGPGTNLTGNVSDNVLDFGPKWSPDGAKIVFTRSTNGGPGEVWIMNTDGSGQQLLTAGVVTDWGVQ